MYIMNNKNSETIEVFRKGGSNEKRLKKEERYYSVWKCAFCKPLEKSKKGYINPPTCPYTKVEIDGKIYERDRGCMFDLVADPGLVEDKLVGEPCRCCGVIYGNVHHVECDSESCPVEPYDRQFLGCGHDMDAKYLKGPSFKEYAYHPGLLRQLTG